MPMIESPTNRPSEPGEAAGSEQLELRIAGVLQSDLLGEDVPVPDDVRFTCDSPVLGKLW